MNNFLSKCTLLIFLILSGPGVGSSQQKPPEEKFIDGIKLRYSQNSARVDTGIGISDEGRIILSSVDPNVDHLKDPNLMFPINIVFPEKLMSSFTFRGAVLEFNQKLTVDDMAPQGEASTGYLRQKAADRQYLEQNFFNSTELSFISGKSRWALTGDLDFITTVLGYYWGFFIPITENHRILKVGLGPALGYAESTIKLYLCAEYTTSGACTQKTFIDKGQYAKPFLTLSFHYNLYQRITENSILSLVAWTGSTAGSQDISYRFENRDSSAIKENSQTGQFEIISYTFRF
jgi:hypothetical protein